MGEGTAMNRRLPAAPCCTYLLVFLNAKPSTYMYILLPTIFGFTNARDFLHTLDGIICPVPLRAAFTAL